MFTEADYLKTLNDFKNRINHLEMQNSLLQKEMVHLEEDNKLLILEAHGLKIWTAIIALWSVCGLLILGVK
jgi:predicted membrane protein